MITAGEVPIEGMATWNLMDAIDQKTESSEPGERNDHIHWTSISIVTIKVLGFQLCIQGQVKKLDEKGINQSKPKSIDRPAMTSV